MRRPFVAPASQGRFSGPVSRETHVSRSLTPSISQQVFTQSSEEDLKDRGGGPEKIGEAMRSEEEIGEALGEDIGDALGETLGEAFWKRSGEALGGNLPGGDRGGARGSLSGGNRGGVRESP